LLGCIGVILVIVAVRGLTHHTPAQPHTARGPAHLFSSTSNEGRGTLPATGRAGKQASNTAPSNPTKHLRSSHTVSSAGGPQTASQQPADTQPNSMPVSELAARFPALAHQAITAGPSGGTEPQYFMRLGNLLNGTPLPAGTQIGENAEHLAHAEADLDRDNLAGAISETERLSGPAARVMSKWLADARARIAQRNTTPATRLAQATPQKRAWPDVMPTEVPPFARESSGPPPAP
jgi:hypothetical protein